MSKLKLTEAFDMYRDDYILFRGQSQRIYETHEYAKRTLIAAIGDKPVEDFTVDDAKKWKSYISKDRCSNTVRNDLIRLRAVFRYLRIRDIKCINPDLIPVPKRADTVPSFLTEEEVARMIDCAFSLRNKFIISLLYSSGIRLSEFISLNRGQIIDKRFSVVGKGGKARLCFIDDRTQDLMDRYLETRTDDSEALAISRVNKTRMTATNVQLLIKNSADRAGITKKVTPHTLRHSYATNFLKNNGNIRYLSQMLGHSSLDTTAIYTHVVDYDMQKQYEKYHTI